MSTGRLHHLANQFRAQLQQKNAQAAESLTREHKRTIQQIQPQLNELYRDIDAKQREASADDAKVPVLWLHTSGWLETIKQFVQYHVNNFALSAKAQVVQAIDWAAKLGSQAADMFIKTLMPGPLSFDTPAPRVPRLSSLLSQAADKLRGIFGCMGTEVAQHVSDVLILGLSLGQKPRDIATQITQKLDEPRWRSLTIAATELFKAYNSTLMEHYQVNAHLITGWVWMCKLSPRSCACCVALHGSVHSLSEVLHDHPNGECMPIPYVHGMELPQSGIDWFDEQDEALQREILGTEVAYGLFKSGVPLSTFVGMDHDVTWGTSVYQRSVKQIKT